MRLVFINAQPYPCGCRMSTSDGGGEYATVTRVWLCEHHSPPTSPEQDAKDAGYEERADGSWRLSNRPVIGIEGQSLTDRVRGERACLTARTVSNNK